MTKAKRAEKDEAIAQLREWIKPGDTVYTVLESVSRSGMQREIRVVVPYVKDQRPCDCHYYTPQAPHYIGTAHVDFLHPNWSISKALGVRQGKRDGLIMGGCGMDMGFALVHELSYALYGQRRCTQCKRSIPEDYPTDVTCGECDGEITGGYQCLGEGKCPSAYHSNHRDRVRCEGVGDRRCYAPEPWGKWGVPEDWPRRTVPVEGVEYPAGTQACITYDAGEIPIGTKDLIMREDGSALQVCPTCKGEGDLPNPDGPERFDLVHTDGYALRHRWL